MSDTTVIIDFRGPPGAAGPSTAAGISYDDSQTGLGVSSVQQAIAYLASVVASLSVGVGPSLDFSNPDNFLFGLSNGVI